MSKWPPKMTDDQKKWKWTVSSFRKKWGCCITPFVKMCKLCAKEQGPKYDANNLKIVKGEEIVREIGWKHIHLFTGCRLHLKWLYRCDKMEGETTRWWTDVRADNEAWQNKQSNIPSRLHPEVINGNLIRCSAGCFASAPNRPSPAR